MNKSIKTVFLNYASVYTHWVSGIQTYSKYIRYLESERVWFICGENIILLVYIPK